MSKNNKINLIMHSGIIKTTRQAVCALIILLLSQDAVPAAAMSKSRVLFEDPLDGRTVPGWSAPLNPFIETPDGNKAFLFTDSGNKKDSISPMAGNDSWENYRLTVEILPVSEKGFLGVNFNVQKDGCCCDIHFPIFSDELSIQPMRECELGTTTWKLWLPSQRKIPFPRGQWIRMRIDAGRTVANVYVNDDPTPLLTFYDLPSPSGGVRFWASWEASGYYRNLRVESLDANDVKPVLDDAWGKVRNQNVLRNWRVTNLLPAGFGTDGFPADVCDGSMHWKIVETDARGIVDLSKAFPKYGKQTVYAETVIQSEKECIRKAWFTYTDRFTLYCNGKQIFKGPDRNWFNPNCEKYGYSRLIPDQFEINIPLNAGENKLCVRSENLEDYQFGWGFWIRME